MSIKTIGGEWPVGQRVWYTGPSLDLEEIGVSQRSAWALCNPYVGGVAKAHGFVLAGVAGEAMSDERWSVSSLKEGFAIIEVQPQLANGINALILARAKELAVGELFCQTDQNGNDIIVDAATFDKALEAYEKVPPAEFDSSGWEPEDNQTPIISERYAYLRAYEVVDELNSLLGHYRRVLQGVVCESLALAGVRVNL